MVQVVNGKVVTPPVAIMGSKGGPQGLADIIKVKATPTVDTAGNNNRSILKGLGIDLDTILTPNKNKKKKRNGQNDSPLQGEPELKTALGE